MSYTECVFELPNYKIRGRRYGSSSGDKIIALHGWLDNCASFELMAPELAEYEVVALDLAGNGQSDHRSPDSEYSIWADVCDVVGVVNLLGWQTFNMVGHSRGAAVCTLVAGSFPQRVSSLSLIDGGIPMVADASSAAETLAKAVEQRLAFKPSEGRIYDSVEQAAFARSKGMWPLSSDAALRLANRGVEMLDSGCRWRSDKRLNLASEVRLSGDQFLSFVNAVECSVKVFMADQGIAHKYPQFKEGMAALLPFDRCVLPGGHHLHLEEDTFKALTQSIVTYLDNIKTIAE